MRWESRDVDTRFEMPSFGKSYFVLTYLTSTPHHDVHAGLQTTSSQDITGINLTMVSVSWEHTGSTEDLVHVLCLFDN
jgi:hypothetical protein